MAEDFLGKLIGNTVRARLLRVFLFNQTEPFTLPQAAKRAGISANVAAKELKGLEQFAIIKKKIVKLPAQPSKGQKKSERAKSESVWSINTAFKHYVALSKFVHEVSPMHYDSVIHALKRTGRLATVILSGTFLGDPSRPADIIVAADALNETRLEAAVRTLEPIFGREIRYAAFSTPEFRYRLTIQDRLIRDTLDYPHLVLLDRTRML